MSKLTLSAGPLFVVAALSGLLAGCNALTAPSEFEVVKEKPKPAATQQAAAPGGAVQNAAEGPKAPAAPEAKPIKLQPAPPPAAPPAQPPSGSCGG